MNGGMKRRQARQSSPITSLEQYSRTSLKSLFAEVCQHPSPRHASARFLHSHVAWHLQAAEANIDPPVFRQSVIRKLQAHRSTKSRQWAEGTQLIREWHGTVYEVSVLNKGYRWEDRHYASLSKIAHEITGVKWSGPRFFGLKQSK